MTATTDVVASCSFCTKACTQVRTLVAGPGVYICDECVSLCSVLIADKPPTATPATRASRARAGSAEVEQAGRIAPWDAEPDLDAVLASLPRVALAGRQAEYTLTQYVRKARELGATWASIGRALGMARQSAWERFSGEE
jgi:hypothetical protein